MRQFSLADADSQSADLHLCKMGCELVSFPRDRRRIVIELRFGEAKGAIVHHVTSVTSSSEIRVQQLMIDDICQIHERHARVIEVRIHPNLIFICDVTREVLGFDPGRIGELGKLADGCVTRRPFDLRRRKLGKIRCLQIAGQNLQIATAPNLCSDSDLLAESHAARRNRTRLGHLFAYAASLQYDQAFASRRRSRESAENLRSVTPSDCSSAPPRDAFTLESKMPLEGRPQLT